MAAKVVLLSWSGGETVAALAAKLCYSSSDLDGLTEKINNEDQTSFINMISSLGHHSVFEHVSFTFAIEGVSRALTHQLVRHRLASYSQQSQRYVKYKDGFNYITPPKILADEQIKDRYDTIMQNLSSMYKELLDLGLPAEDARYILPNACETKIVATMNARELLHFIKLRTCERAQWEIKELAIQMLKIAVEKAPVIFRNAGPACVKGPCSEGKMTCGKPKEISAYFRKLTNKSKQV